MSDFVNTQIVLLLVIPLSGAAIALFEKAAPKLNISRFVALLCVGAGIVPLVILYPAVTGGGEIQYLLGGWPEPYGITLRMDGLSWLGSLVTYGTAFPILLYAVNERAYPASFYFFFLVMIAAMEGLMLSSDIFNIFVFFEILALCSCILVAFLKKPHAVVASFKYLMISTLGISFFLVGVFILYRLTGTLAMQDIGERLNIIFSSGADPALQRAGTLAVVCLIAGIGIRIAFMPFHFWLPEAHAYGPHPVSAILSGVMIKISFIVLWRFTAFFNVLDVGEYLVISGAVTACLGVVWALVQTDAKKLLAFHSVSQMGYIIAAFGAGTVISKTASFYHLVNHALFKSLLFLSIGTVISCTDERRVKKLRGLGLKMPLTAIPFGAAALSIAGIPPFNGYASKQLISHSLESHWVYPLIWITGVGTVASFIKLSKIFWGPKEDEPPTADIKDEPSSTTVLGTVLNPGKVSIFIYPALWFLAAACLATGLASNFLSQNIALLSGAAGSASDAASAIPNPFEMKTILESFIPVGAGFFLYSAAMSNKGKEFTNVLQKRSIGLEGSLVFLVLGFLILSFYALFSPYAPQL